jgi:hypothetical protein
MQQHRVRARHVECLAAIRKAQPHVASKSTEAASHTSRRASICTLCKALGVLPHCAKSIGKEVTLVANGIVLQVLSQKPSGDGPCLVALFEGVFLPEVFEDFPKRPLPTIHTHNHFVAIFLGLDFEARYCTASNNIAAQTGPPNFIFKSRMSLNKKPNIRIQGIRVAIIHATASI